MRVKDASPGESGTEMVSGEIYLDPTTHLVERSSGTATFIGTRTLPAHGNVAAVTEPERSTFQSSWRRVR